MLNGRVVHDRPGEAVRLRERRVLELLERVDAGGAEVVQEAEGVPDLVHDHVLHVGLRDRLGLRAVHVEAAGLEQVHREVQLAGRLVHVVAGEEAARGAVPVRLGDAPCSGASRSNRRAKSSARPGGGRRGAKTSDMPMSASRISPERGSTCEGPMAKPTSSPGEPAHRGVARVHRVEVVLLGLLLHDDRVPEAGLLEGLVPLEDAVGHALAVLLRDVLVEPVRDGRLRLRDGRGRVLLLQAPAVHDVRAALGRECPRCSRRAST